MSDTNDISQKETETEVEETTAKEQAPAVSVSKKKKSAGLWGLGVLLLLIIAFGALQALGVFKDAPSDKDSDKDGATAQADSSSLVASVNGITITRGELDEKLTQVRSTIPEGAPDPTQDAGFELQLLEELVNLKLLTAAAEGKGYTVSDEELSIEFQGLIEAFGGEEVFLQQLQITSITPEQLKENIRNELLIRQLIDAETDIEEVTASEEEIEELYNAFVSQGGGEGAPSIDEVRELLRAQVIQQKSAGIVDGYVNELRDAAEIDIVL